MGVKERQAFAGHLFQARRFDFAFWIRRRDVSNSQIIGQHKNDVRMRLRVGAGERAQKTNEGDSELFAVVEK